MRIIKTVFLLIAMLLAMPIGVQAQLKKTSNTEKVKSFTNGSVTLYKSIIEDGDTIYSVSLRNNSRYFDNVVFHLGTKDEMIKNLHDLYTALKEGKKGDSFEFSASGVDYLLSYDKVLGQVCFRVREPHSITDDFGRFYKATIDSIITYLEKDNW